MTDEDRARWFGQGLIWAAPVKSWIDLPLDDPEGTARIVVQESATFVMIKS